MLLLLLAGCGGGYQQSGGGYTYVTIDEGQGRVEHVIPGVDSATFKIINQGGYASDAGQVYYQGRPIDGADPATFSTLSALYGVDAAHVYYQDSLIPGADPATFKLLDSQWGRDARDVYFQERPQQVCDLYSFKLLKDDWQIDSQCAYRMGTRLANADPSTFEVINFWFAKDKNQVYENLPTIIEGADPATFKLRKGICQVCAQDKNRCYRYEEVVACQEEK
jgi:hypothetical protein